MKWFFIGQWNVHSWTVCCGSSIYCKKNQNCPVLYTRIVECWSLFLAVVCVRSSRHRVSSLLHTIDKVRRSVFALVTAALISPAADYCRVVDSDTASCSISSPTAKRLFHRFIASPSSLQTLQFRQPGGGEMQPSARRQQVLDMVPRADSTELEIKLNVEWLVAVNLLSC